MFPLVQRLARLTIIAGLLIAPLAPQPQPAKTTPAGEQPTAGMYPEVRLRKLHLVRPDLIPYPLFFEVCC